ncbi:MAG: MoaF N-terminal domain-containing protein [Firmicutes bacterium]|nr:MoaF N-terminal domain-containing protein [Bacillota bacterium]
MLQRKERRWLYLTLDEVKAIGAQMNTESVWHEELKNPMMVTDTRLSGTKMKFDFEDGTVFCYDFKDERHLAWEASDGRKGEEIYNSSPAPGYDNIIFVHHYCSLEVPGCVDLVIDLERGYAFLIDASLGHPENPREVIRELRFGKIDGMEQKGEKPCFTNDLTGKAIRWRHPGTNSEGIKYIFSSCNYYTYAMKYKDAGLCWMATNPADYIKFRDDLYICAVIEARQTGVQLVMMMNMSMLTDIQTEFGLGGPNEKCSYLETFMRSGREGIPDVMETDLFNY